jgi:glycosyltransferase involved in cell wall biosynthesis
VRILITEEALRLGNGHWPRYVQDLAEGFRAAGDHVDILAHKEAGEKVFDAVPGAVPWFSRDCRADPRSQGLIGGLRHNLSFYRDLAAWLHGHEPYDWVLSLSSRPKHLLAFALLARAGALARTRYLVLFVLGFGKVAEHKPVGGLGEFRLSAANLFAKLCFFLLQGTVRRGQVVLAAETKGMQGELERFSGLPASLYPHPVEWGKAQESQEGDLAERRDNPIVVIAPGFARHEKGTDLLQEAIKIIKSGKCGLGVADRSVRFVLQWQEDFTFPDGTTARPDEELKRTGDVEYLGGILVGSQYLNFLKSGDLVVLPYRSHSYSRRVSRVSVEAALLGKPIIFTRNTWSAEVAEMAGCGVEVPEETPEAIASAILSALSNIERLRVCAAIGARVVLEYYSVAQFRTLLQKEKIKK